MNTTKIKRRSFIKGLVGALFAPKVLKAEKKPKAIIECDSAWKKSQSKVFISRTFTEKELKQVAMNGFGIFKVYPPKPEFDNIHIMEVKS